MWKIGTLAMGSLLVACTNTSLVDNGVIKIETAAAQPVTISYADARRVDGQLVINGELEYPSWVRFGQFTGHIDISVSSPSGKVVEQHNIEPLRRRVPLTLGRKARFVATFQLDPRPETIVYISYTNEDHSGKG